jgi:hypothetical protein
MRAFVTEATGALGPQPGPELVATGYEVTATTRTPAKASQLDQAGAQPVIGGGIWSFIDIAAAAAAIFGPADHEPVAAAPSLTANRPRSQSGCRNRPGSQARSRRCGRPPGSGSSP